MKKNNAKKIIFNTAFFVVCLALTFLYIFKDKNLSEVFDFVSNVNPIYTFLGVVLVLIFIMTESIIFHYIFRSLKQEHKFSHCVLYSFVGFFFSLITPAALGGQPIQFIFMKKDKVPAHIGLITLTIVTVTYKMVLAILGLIVVIFRPGKIMPYIDSVMPWIYLGTFLNFVCVAALLSLIFFPKFTKKMIVGIFSLLSKITKSEKLKRLETRAEKSMDKYHDTAGFIISHKKVTLNVLWITFIQRFALFFVTYVTFLGFNIHGSMPVIVLLQGIICVATEMLPLPGGLGVNEALFEIIYQPLTGEDLVTPVMIVSRGLSYYIQLFMCAIMTVVAYFKIIRRKEEKEKTNG